MRIGNNDGTTNTQTRYHIEKLYTSNTGIEPGILEMATSWYTLCKPFDHGGRQIYIVDIVPLNYAANSSEVFNGSKQKPATRHYSPAYMVEISTAESGKPKKYSAFISCMCTIYVVNVSSCMSCISATWEVV